MNTKELNKKLKILGIPSDAYSTVGGLPNEAYCIGNNEGKWEIYYSERGNKTGGKSFASEEEACEQFLSCMKRTFKK
ncbi:hypothetical protein [Oceanirhabdus sp. W0125-5]|uniref:hypothetical protein n=1 Tax=Oceanirhabdus sp. W0125-5 TaxID=2999116 RepID=UPI0022F32044|nr:hypothetical protein [Oceanirhabdus sp. W0125-5]WBW95945.1 hypothetical protein OW730_19965 [Oceanirhabdus sp. W0125-5]